MSFATMAIIPVTGQMWVVQCGLLWGQAIDIPLGCARSRTRGAGLAGSGRASGRGRGCSRGLRGTDVLSVVCEKTPIDVCESVREVQHSHLGRAQRRVYHKRLWASICVETAPLPIVIVFAFAAVIQIPITCQVWVVRCSLLWGQARNIPGLGWESGWHGRWDSCCQSWDLRRAVCWRDVRRDVRRDLRRDRGIQSGRNRRYSRGVCWCCRCGGKCG